MDELDAAPPAIEPAQEAPPSPVQEPEQGAAPVKRGRGRPKGSGKKRLIVDGREVKLPKRVEGRGTARRSRGNPPGPNDPLPKSYIRCECGQAVHISRKVCPNCQEVPPWKRSAAAAHQRELDRIAAADLRRMQRRGVQVGGAIFRLPEVGEIVDRASVPHVTKAAIHHQVDGVLVDLPAGRVIYSYPLIKALLAGKAPIVPVSGQENLVCCPSCAEIFELPKKKVLAAA